MSYASPRGMKRARLRAAASRYRSDFGCGCKDPQVSYRAAGPTIPGVDHVTVVHDDGCPAIVGRIGMFIPAGFGRCKR